MKVAIHVGQLLQPTPGGIGRYVEELVLALRDQPVSMLPFAAGPLPPAVRARLGGPGHAELAYRDLGRPHGSQRYLLWHYLRGPGLRLGEVDVVHAPSVAVPPPGRAPLVVTIHDVAFLRCPEHFTRWGVRFHARGLALSRRHAAAIVVASEFTRDELVREGFDPVRLHVVPHGVRVDAPAPPDDATRLRTLGIERPFVLFVGTIEPRKGVALLIDVVREVRATHPSLALAVAGPRGWGAVAGLDEPWVHELGAVEDRDLDALYRTALLCAVPSSYEGFGFPALEAMARGCPVLASDTTSLPEVLGDGGLLLPVDDRRAWRDAIVTLVDDADRRAALGERGRIRAGQYTWERSAAGHLAAYRAAAHHSAARR
ncbi:MAG: glycosyltransferase family 1 protein [Acidimicrobiia bacterium]